MPVTKKTTNLGEQAISVIQVSQDETTFRLIGTTPLIQEAVSDKARRELLFPRGRLNAAAKATTLKHDPRSEYVAGMYRVRSGPTLLAMPATSFKDAIRTAALDLTGVSKTEIGRLTLVVGNMIPVYGTPQLVMSVVRSADMARTPDIRTRPILPEWCAEITIRFTQPKMNAQAINRLVVAAGYTCGVGGWRQEKGSGNYGLWRLFEKGDDAEWDRIVENGGRIQQAEAVEAPQPYDEETASLLNWYEDELQERRAKGAA